MKVSIEEIRNPMEDLNLHRYDDLLVGKISRDLQNICNFVPVNLVSNVEDFFISIFYKPKILQKSYFLKKLMAEELDLC